jgi:hypothetical protein
MDRYVWGISFIVGTVFISVCYVHGRAMNVDTTERMEQRHKTTKRREEERKNKKQTN